MTVPRPLLAVLFAVLTAVIVWASIEKNVFVGVDWIVSERWGIATLVDVYCAFTLLGIYMGWRERSVTRGIFLTAATYLLGSLVPLGYLFWKQGTRTP